MSCAVDWEQFRASVQYQNFIVSCFPYHFRVRQITFSARIRLNHLGVVQILRKARITHRIKILSLLSKILSAIPLVLIHLVSLFITYSVSFSLSLSYLFLMIYLCMFCKKTLTCFLMYFKISSGENKFRASIVYLG